MLKDFLWKAFESTGSVDAYIVIKEIEAKNRAEYETKIAKEEVAISNPLT